MQLALHEEILRSGSLKELGDARFAIASIAMQYVRGSITPILQQMLVDSVNRTVHASELDLSTDPLEVSG